MDFLANSINSTVGNRAEQVTEDPAPGTLVMKKGWTGHQGSLTRRNLQLCPVTHDYLR